MKAISLNVLPLLLLATACASPEVREHLANSENALVTGGSYPACPEGVDCYDGEQGRSLLGIVPDLARVRLMYNSARWDDLALTRPPLQSVSIDGTGVRAFADGRVLAPEELVGLEMDDGQAGTSYRISALWEPDSRGRARYVVEVNQAGAGWQPLCADGDYAYAIPGYFENVVSSRYFSALDSGMFACGTGGAAKAVRWGLSPADVQGRDFSAAVRLARAEYCADMHSHTIDGTSVVIATLQGATGPVVEQPTSPGNPGPFYYEAAWHGMGTNSPTSNVIISDYGVVCLSKLRWQSLPPGGFCPKVVRDPRMTTEFDPVRPVFCDDLPGFTQVPTAAFLTQVRDQYNASVSSLSQFNDRGLWLWKSANTNDRIATTTGFWAGDLGVSQPPADGYVFDGHPSLMAHVLTWPAAGTVPLYLYKNSTTGDFKTTKDGHLDAIRCTSVFCALSPWVKQGAPIGYMYPDSLSMEEGRSPIALRQYVRKNSANVVLDYVLIAEGTAVPPGYTLESAASVVEGYGF